MSSDFTGVEKSVMVRCASAIHEIINNPNHHEVGVLLKGLIVGL